MPSLAVYLLGLPRVELRGAAVRPERQKATALLAYLVVTGGRHGRDRLASLLWPEQGADRARASLRRALASLTRALPGPWWRADRDSIGLDLSPEVSVDVLEFRSLVEAAAPLSGSAAEERLRQAAELYRDDFLAGFGLRDAPEFDEWQLYEGESLHREFAGVLERLSRVGCERRAYDESTVYARRLVRLDPLDEMAHCLLMQVYGLSGQRAAALRQYSECELLLERELGILPEEARRLRDRIRRGEELVPEDATVPPPTRAAPGSRAGVAGAGRQEATTRTGMSIAPAAAVRLIGRERELAQIDALLQGAAQGKGKGLLVSGDPGVGKTRLAEEILELAPASGFRVLRAGCPPEGGVPFAPLRQLLKEALRAPAEGGQRELPAWLLANLLPLAPELGTGEVASTDRLSLETPADRLRLADSVIELIRRLAAESPVLLLVDDLHWSDPATLAVLRHLFGRVTGLPVILVATYREAEASAYEALTELLLLLEGERLAEFMSLSPLEEDQTRQLLRALLRTEDEISLEFLERLHGETGGNPLFIQEICKSLLEGGNLFHSGGYWRRQDMAGLALPGTVRAAILSRIDRLADNARQLLRCAAVIGQEFALATLRRVVNLDEEALTDGLERAEAMQIIRLVDGPEKAFSFAHPLIPFALRESLSRLHLQRLHERVARALESDRVLMPDALARHFLAAGEYREAVRYLLLAAGKAEGLFAYETAAAHLERALDLLAGGEAEAETRRAALERLADLYALTGERTQAIGRYLAALDVWRDLPDDGSLAEVRLHRKVIEAYGGLRDLAETQRFREAVETSIAAGLELIDARLPHPETVLFLASLANDPWDARDQDWPEAERHALLAVEMAEEIGSPELISFALGAVSTVLGVQQRLRERAEVCRRRLKLSRSRRFRDRQQRLSVLCEAGAALLRVGEFADSMSCLLEAERLAGETRAVDAHLYAISLQAECLFGLDRWDDMFQIEAKRRALEQEYSLERVGRFCFYCGLSASVHAIRGELEEARAHRQEAHAMMAPSFGPVESWPRGGLYCRGKALLAAGQHELATEELTKALWTSASWVGDHDLYATLVDGAALQHDATLLAKYAPAAERTAMEVGHRLYEAVAHRAWGILHLLGGEYGPAQTRLEQALAIFGRLGTKWQLGRTHEALAELAKAGGDLEASRLHLASALRAFEELGAAPDSDRLRGVLSAGDGETV